MNIIDNFRDLTVGDYEKILAISLEVKALPEGDDADALPYQARIIAVLMGTTERDVLNLNIADYKTAAEKADFLLRAGDFTDGKRTAASYQVGKFILEPTIDVRNLTAAQYIDFQTFTAAEGVHLAEVLSVMMVPRGMKYADGYDPLEVQQAIREDMSAAEALDLMDFFIGRWEVLTADTLTSLRAEIAQIKRQKGKEMRAAAASRTDGPGSPS